MKHILVLLLIIWAGGSAPAKAEWLRAESPNFIVFSEESEARVRERAVMLENFDRLLRLVTTNNEEPAANKLHVYVVDDLEALQTIRAVPAGIAGFYTATPYGIAAFVDRSAASRNRTGRYADANEVLFHEYAHHFMMQYGTNAYPAWYVEGFAEYFMTTQFRERSIDIGNFSPGRAYSIVEGSWLPIERVLFGDTEGLNREQSAMFYAQSWLITHYFYSSAERQAGLRRYLVGARQGDRSAALQAATGFTPEQFGEQVRQYIRGRRINYRRMNVDESQPAPAVTVTRLPAAANDLMLYEAAMRVGVSAENEDSYLQRIRAVAARHPEDAFARRALAQAEALYGDGAAADRLLEGLMAASPNDAELMYVKGLRHLTAALDGDDWDADARPARIWFSRAHRADGNHYQTLFRYAQSLRGQPGYVSENTANILLLAHQLAPQVAEITMDAAVMLMNRRQFAEAEALLAPLAADPHQTGLAQAAQQLMAQARSAESGGSDEGEPPPASE